MQEYSPNESQYSKQQIYGYNDRKLKKQKQKQNTKIDVCRLILRESVGNECLIFSSMAGEAWEFICRS